MAPLYPVPKSHGHHKSTNKLTLNEKAVTVVYTGFPMGRCQPSSGVPTLRPPPPSPAIILRGFGLEVTGVPEQPPRHIHFVKNYSDTTLYQDEIRNSSRVKALSLLVYIFLQFFFQKTPRVRQFCILQKESPHKIALNCLHRGDLANSPL